MLSNEVMGLLALAILWVNTLLVAGQAWRELRALGKRRRRLRLLAPGEAGVGMIAGEVIAGAGEQAPLARHEIEQTGRQAADDQGRHAIAWSDRAYRGSVLGGTLRAGEVEIDVPAAEEAEIWLPVETVASAARCPGDEAFAAAYADARKAKGFARTVAAEIGPGARVWIAGEVRLGDGASIHAADDARLLIATLDPRAVCARKMRLLVGFLFAVLAGAAACTAVALYPPRFGLVSTVGGALCLAYFLLVQPAGTAARDAVLLPHRRTLRGSWSAPGIGSG